MENKLKPNEILKNADNLTCTCPEKSCEWHGNCRDCVALHRYHATVPECLKIEFEKQNIMNIDFIKKNW